MSRQAVFGLETLRTDEVLEFGLYSGLDGVGHLIVVFRYVMLLEEVAVHLPHEAVADRAVITPKKRENINYVLTKVK